AVAGAKAAWLARGRRSGLPVLPGVVVTSAASASHIATGVDALQRRGSGGARLEVSQKSLDDELVAELDGVPLGEPFVVRSSSPLEGSGVWSGAFTSYVGINRAELPVAIAGCWASLFSPAVLDRQGTMGVEPGSVPLALLVQPEVSPEWSGVARFEGSLVTIDAVQGPPAPLVQGWATGIRAVVHDDGAIMGEADRIGPARLGALADLMRVARLAVGATTAEWAWTAAGLTLLQLGISPVRQRPQSAPPRVTMSMDRAESFARLVRRYPGPLGEAMVLGWAVTDPDAWSDPVPPAEASPAEAWRETQELAGRLTSSTWDMPPHAAGDHARLLLRSLRSDRPDLEAIDRGRKVSRGDGRRLLARLGSVIRHLDRMGLRLGWDLDPAEVTALFEGAEAPPRERVGFDRWEPFGAAVTMAAGRSVMCVAASPGLGHGRLAFVSQERIEPVHPRQVVVAQYPVPHMSPLLWDAAGLVTAGGSPAAHLFESARALGLPAVCGVDLEELLGMSPAEATGQVAIAVDGTAGSVAAVPW
ncbi:MAG TPA: PEP-utilizing enzyme, partial [Acidimicrobiia bacterium]|nr:PEP-utilizing enzyme [Acidimicrobiia bacterium]